MDTGASTQKDEIQDAVHLPNGIQWIRPGWPAPPGVRACTTLRRGGVSRPPYASLNLADHVGDEHHSVVVNRFRMRCSVELPSAPQWLDQTHGARVVDLSTMSSPCEADASYTDKKGGVCAVLTADCLPLLLCDQEGGWIAAAHVGWRGLAAGVVEATLGAYGSGTDRMMAWMGPAIGPDAFEVGGDVREILIAQDSKAGNAFRPALREGHWLADIYRIVRLRLTGQGVRSIYGGQWCTYKEPESFYSYRRDGVTGRMASMIWIQDGSS